MAKTNEVDYKTIAVNAMVSATATALTLGLLSMLFRKDKQGLGIPRKVLANLPLEKQAHFVDPVTAGNIRNRDWILRQMEEVDIDNPETYRNVNATAIGNCAFIALYATDPEIRAKCLEILKRFKMYA